MSHETNLIKDCMNCFNPRLRKIKISTIGDDLSFEVTHLGVEMFPRMEGQSRSFETFHNAPEIFETAKDTFLEILSEKSPFANFLINAREGNYGECLKDGFSQYEIDLCKYEMRTKIKKIVLDLVFDEFPNFSPQYC